MRSPPRSLVLFFATLASSAVINAPSSSSGSVRNGPRETEQSPPDVKTGLVPHVPGISFSIPCLDCLGTEDLPSGIDRLPFDFQAFSVNEACGTSNVSLNGQTLIQEWDGTDARGKGNLPVSLLNNIHSTIDLSLEWNTSCLFQNPDELQPRPDSAAQALTVFVKAVNGIPVTSSSGFTISYKQIGSPELLRLSLAPEPAAGGRESSEEWRDPPEHLRLSLPLDLPSIVESDSLNKHINELAKLEDDARMLAGLIEEKKRIIEAESQTQLKPTKCLLEKCKNWDCVFRTIAGKVRSAAKAAYAKFQDHRHRPDQSSIHDSSRAYSHWHNKEVAILSNADSVTSASTSAVSGCNSMNDGAHANHPQASGDCPENSSESTPTAFGHHFNSEHDFRHRSPKETLILSLEVLVGILGVAAVFLIIQRNCCSLRRKTDRRARREERRAQREYRQLARRQAWRDWWYGRDRRRIQDYEEKRAMILDQEERLEGEMQAEIRAFRRAHDLVQNIVQMEEGRLYNPHSPDRPPSRSSSLPDYRSEVSSLPPAYDEDGGSDVVANGFRQYRPTSTAQWTPGSSVIALSPRPSSETLRRSAEDDNCEQQRNRAHDSESESEFYSDDRENADEKC